MTEYGFSIQAAFEQLQRPSLDYYEWSGVRGVLRFISLPQLPSEGEMPTVGLDFLETNLRNERGMTHLDLLQLSPYSYEPGDLPTLRLHRDPPVNLAVRYDLEQGTRSKLDLLLDSAGDVREQPNYIELRNTVALACAAALFERHGEIIDHGLILHHVPNFSTRRPSARPQQFLGTTLEELAAGLGVKRP